MRIGNDDPVDRGDGHQSLMDVEMIADTIPHIVFVAGPDGATQYVNSRMTDYTGLPSAANSGWGWLELVHPDDVHLARRAREQAVRGKASYEVQYRIRRFDGAYRWHTIRANAVRDRRGRVFKWIGTATDVDDEKRAIERLQTSERESAESAILLETLQDSAPVGFGFIDNEFRIRRVNRTLAALYGGEPTAYLGRLVSDVVPEHWPVVEPILVEVSRSGRPLLNRELTERARTDGERSRSWLVSYYPVSLPDERIGIGVVVIDITSRREAERVHYQLARATVSAMAGAVEAKDPYTAGHQLRVAEISAAIAERLGLGEFEVEGIRLAASIHDLGKIGIPSEILARPGPLRPAELELVQGHSTIGHGIVAGIDFPWPVAEMILRHHERCDGSGYPGGLTREEIPLGARIIAVADTVEAMSAHRPYRPASGLDSALETIRRTRGTLYDADVVDACEELFAAGRLPML